MKKRIIVLLFLLLVPIVLAEQTMYNGDSVVVGGKTVTVTGITEGRVKVEVDGVKNIIEETEKEIINGVEILVVSVYYFGDETNYAVLSFGSQTSEENNTEGESSYCGDDKCDDATEDKTNCCKDCGCESGFSCADNNCLKNECSNDDECRDDDECTLDKCSGKPKKCSNNKIEECVVNDKCCPEKCYYPDDSDCSPDKVNSNSKEDLPVKAFGDEGLDVEKGEKSLSVKGGEKVGFFKKIINWLKNLFR